MATKKQTLGFLIVVLTLVAGTITGIVITQDNLSINIKPNSATFKSKQGSLWITTGIEKLYIDGKLVSGSLSQELLENNYMKITRTNSSWYDTYEFDGSLKNVETFPVSHTIHVKDSKGKQFKYVVSSLKGVTSAHNVVSGEGFGYKMEVEFDDGYISAKVTKAGTMTVIYTIPSDDWTLNVRLFDPCTTPTENMSINTDTTFCTGTYYFNDTTDGAIIINASNVVIDCNGSTLIGNTSGYAFQPAVSTYNNLTFKNCNIMNYNRGINLGGSDDVLVIGNNISNVAIAVRMTTGTLRTNITQNYFFNTTAQAVDISGSSNTSITNNTFVNVSLCTANAGGHYEIIDGNRCYPKNNNGGFSHNTGMNYSTIRNNVIYLNNKSGSTAGITYYGGSGVGHNVYNNNITGFNYGIVFSINHSNSLIYGNKINYTGLWSISIQNNCTNNSVYDNDLTESDWNLIYIAGYDNKIYSNRLNNYYHHGIDAHNDLNGTLGTGNSIYLNNITKTLSAFDTGDCAIFVASLSSTSVYGNYLYNLLNNNTIPVAGICIENPVYGNDNLIYNNVLNNVSGRNLYDTANRSIWTNNTIRNSDNAYANVISLSVVGTPPKVATFINNVHENKKMNYTIGNSNNVLNIYDNVTNGFTVLSTGVSGNNTINVYNRLAKWPYNDADNDTVHSVLISSNFDNVTKAISPNEVLYIDFFNTTGKVNKNITISGILCPINDTCIVTLDYDLAEVTP